MPNQTAVMETARGTMELDLYVDEAPNTVANFEKLANAGFYDGTKFHRVIPNFMIQGGDPYSKSGKGSVGTGGPGYTIKCETSGNTHKHVAGTLSMAHASRLGVHRVDLRNSFSLKNPSGMKPSMKLSARSSIRSRENTHIAFL